LHSECVVDKYCILAPRQPKDDAEANDEDEEDDEDDENEDDDEEDDDDDESDEEYEGEPDVLEGLRTILEIAPEKVLPILLPQLTTPTVSVFSLKVLASLAPSLGEDDALQGFLPELMRSIVTALAKEGPSDEDKEQMLKASKVLVLEGVSQEGVHKLITALVEIIESSGPRGLMHDGRQATVCAQLLGALCAGTAHDLNEYVPMMFQTLLPLLNAYHASTQDAVLDALEALVNSIEKDELVMHVAMVHKTINNMLTDQTGEVYIHTMPAFERPKGMAPLWPLFQHGLLYGTPEVRTESAKSVGVLIGLTPADALKPVLVSKLAGNPYLHHF
jgi:hypothetical protein